MNPELLKACQAATAAIFADADVKCNALEESDDLPPLHCPRTTGDVVVNYQYFAAYCGKHCSAV